MFKKLLILVTLVLTACVGTRDVLYHPNGVERGTIETVNSEWWDAVVGLQREKDEDVLFCSGVAIGYSKENNETYVVSAKHCTTNFSKRITQVVGMYYYGLNKSTNNRGFYTQTFKVKQIKNHPSKDIAFLIVDGEVPHRTQVYKGYVKSQDYVIIGYPGGILTKKVAQKNWADHGQSGGGVFTEGYGLHTIVSTHIDGVNVWQALQDLKLEWMIENN